MDQEWLEQWMRETRAAFGARVRFMGIQGSQARGEARADSDIDVVLVLDEFSYTDLECYNAVLSRLPRREKICGFVAGEEELRAWERADLFQFYHDTRPLWGDLKWMEAFRTPENARRAMLRDACNVYHGCAHNALHGKSALVLRSLLKSVFFILQAKYYIKTGEYPRTRAWLRDRLTGKDQAMLEAAMEDADAADFDALSRQLLDWAGEVIRSAQRENRAVRAGEG